MFYDPVLDSYVIGDGYSYTHIELFWLLDEENYYAGHEEEINQKYGGFNHYATGCREDDEPDEPSDDAGLLYMAFYPKTDNNEDVEREEHDAKYSFDYKYTYSFGTLYIRGHKLEECDLYLALSKYSTDTSAKLTETVHVNPKAELSAVQQITAALSDEEFDRIGNAYWIDSPYIIYRKVAYNEEKHPIGFIDVYYLPAELKLDWLKDYPKSGVVVLAVTPEARGSGIGFRLGKDMVDLFHSTDMGVDRLYWSVDIADDTGAASKSIAERLGFKKVSTSNGLAEYILELKFNPDNGLETQISKTEFGDKVDFYEGDVYIGTACTATVDNKDDFIYDVFVSPPCRGRGYGTYIMR